MSCCSVGHTIALASHNHAWHLQVVGVWFYEEGEARKVAALLQQISMQGKSLGDTVETTSLVGKGYLHRRGNPSCIILISCSAAEHCVKSSALTSVTPIDLTCPFLSLVAG